MDKLVGKFIVLDGPDGAGKGTQLELLGRRLDQMGVAMVRAKDPGGTAIGRRVRQVLLNYDLKRMDVRCEALLFMASRAQLVTEVIRPALEEGKTVLCDRFISATFAYQGAAGLELEVVRRLGELAVGDTWPDLTIILDVPVELGLKRIGRPGGPSQRHADGQGVIFEGAGLDAMELRSLRFHRKVRRIFRQLPQIYPRPVIIVDGRGPAERVHEKVWEAIGRVDF
ncbi:MAG: dTMP kinase [Phycisphaerae bacterium]